MCTRHLAAGALLVVVAFGLSGVVNINMTPIPQGMVIPGVNEDPHEQIDGVAAVTTEGVNALNADRYTSLLQDQSETINVQHKEMPKKRTIKWFEYQIQRAPGWLKERVDKALKTECTKGFAEHYSAVINLDAEGVRADPIMLEAQLHIYGNQFCTECGSSLYYFSRIFQGMGSRYHSQMCGLDNALRAGVPFATMNGEFLFADESVCPDSNDHCYFKKTTVCARDFCSKSHDSKAQLCKRMKRAVPLQEPPTCGPGGSCLCGNCGSTESGAHETMWAKHSCDAFRTIPFNLSQPRSHLWWSSQLVFFLLQPTEPLNAVLTNDFNDPFFDQPVINAHVRRGKLKEPEMNRFFGLQEYIDVSKAFGEKTKRFFLQTNDPTVTAEVVADKKVASSYEWGWTRWNRTGMDLQIHNDPKKFARRARQGKYLHVNAELWTVHSLRNLWFMMQSPKWICTYSSNWCRLALRLTYATYGRIPEVKSLDDWGFDPYKWYSNAYIAGLGKGF